MDFVPNYDNYTLDELIDVQRNINRDKYPDRAAVVDVLISLKLQDPEIKSTMDKQAELEKYATFGPRFWSSIIDSVIISICSVIIVSAITHVAPVFQVALNYFDTWKFALYSVLLHTLYGQTFGKMIFDIKVVDYKTEGSISLNQALLRDSVPIIMLILLVFFSVFFPLETTEDLSSWKLYTIIGLSISFLIWHLLEIITMLFNEKNRAIHDYLAGTVVIRT